MSVPDGIVRVFDAAEEAGQRAVDDALRRADAAGLATIEGTVEQGASPRHQRVRRRPRRGPRRHGTPDHTGLARYHIDSVAAKVVRTADVSVLTVGRSGGVDGDA